MESITIIYDLETTGFKCMPMFSKYHKVLQISAKCVETGLTFNSFVNPEFKGEIPPASTKVHNIKKSDVEGADTIDVVLRRMYRFFEFDKYIAVELIAHNNNYFDKLIIMKEYKNMGVDEVPSNVVFWDTLPWLRTNYPNLVSYSLGELYKYFFKKEIQNAHRADADVDALMDIYIKYIAPHRNNRESETEILFRMVYEDCLTSIRYLGPFRADKCFYSNKIETVKQLKEFANSFLQRGDPHGFDTWLKEAVGVGNITHRMFIVSHVYEIPIWFDELLHFLKIERTDEDCLNEVDYFVKYEYVLNERPPKPQIYQRGLMKVATQNDW